MYKLTQIVRTRFITHFREGKPVGPPKLDVVVAVCDEAGSLQMLYTYLIGACLKLERLSTYLYVGREIFDAEAAAMALKAGVTVGTFEGFGA